MNGIKVRGIYSSAITNLLAKNKLKIAKPSKNIKESFPKLKFVEEFDTQLHDFTDKSGIVIKGEQTEKVCEIFNKLGSVFVQTENSGHIYLGHIIKLDPNTKNIHVNLGLKKVGLLPLKDYWGYVKEGEKILVQLKNEERDCYILSTKVHLFGRNVVLIQKGFTKIANHIRDKEVIEKLNKVSEKTCEEGWGALWKSSAADKEETELTKEIKGLYSDFEKIKKKFKKESKIQILSKGLITCFVRFSKETKTKLDDLRREIKPTIINHHGLKTDIFANIVDFSENLIKEKVSEQKINKKIKEFVNEKSSRDGDIFLIIKYKLSGSTKFLKGKVVEKNEDSLKLKRFLKSGTNISSINMSVSRGDYMISTIKEDAQFIKNEVFSSNDESKTEFYSINTPIEIHSNRAVLNSLELIVDKKELLNEDILKEYETNNVISKTLVKKALIVAKKLLKKGD